MNIKYKHTIKNGINVVFKLYTFDFEKSLFMPFIGDNIKIPLLLEKYQVIETINKLELVDFKTSNIEYVKNIVAGACLMSMKLINNESILNNGVKMKEYYKLPICNLKVYGNDQAGEFPQCPKRLIIDLLSSPKYPSKELCLCTDFTLICGHRGNPLCLSEVYCGILYESFIEVEKKFKKYCDDNGYIMDYNTMFEFIVSEYRE